MKKFLFTAFILLLAVALASCSLINKPKEEQECQHEYTTEVIAPTCLAEGYTVHTCSKCDESYTDTVVAKTYHRFNGGSCLNCGNAENLENITPDTEWYSEESEIFRLDTKEELAGLAFLVNEGNNFAGKKIYLDANIDLEYYEWIPVGTAEAQFTGSFDGDGYSVFGLKISATSDYAGLFGYVNGSVANLKVEHATVFAKNDTDNIGIVCGYSKNALTGITVSGYVDAVRSNYVGGIVGYANAQVEHSSSYAIVNGHDSVGGIAGHLELSAGVLSKLDYSGSVTGVNCVGGIAGSLYGSDSVQADMITVNGEVKGTQQVGGIVGLANAKLGSEIYGATVCAKVQADYYVGGIIGNTETVAINNCSNEGSEVIADFYLTVGDNFYAYLGGYVGSGYSVNNCVNDVDITYVSRGADIGGVAGYMINAVTNCTNNGDITAADAMNVGGVVGAIDMRIYHGITHNDLTNTGNVTGKTNVGGVVGTIDQHVSFDTEGCNNTSKQTEIYIKNFANSGAVTGTESVGGIVGLVAFDNTYSKYHYTCWCQHDGFSALIAVNLKNDGSVSGNEKVGEIYGNSWSDGVSKVTSYKVTGKITVNGEELEGVYDIGENTNLTLEGRDGPVVEEETEPEAAE